MNALIARYTHTAHVIVDSLIAVELAVYTIFASVGVLLPANGAPAHWIIGINAGLLAASAWLRRASAKLEEIDPAAPVTNAPAGQG